MATSGRIANTCAADFAGVSRDELLNSISHAARKISLNADDSPGEANAETLEADRIDKAPAENQIPQGGFHLAPGPPRILQTQLALVYFVVREAAIARR